METCPVCGEETELLERCPECEVAICAGCTEEGCPHPEIDP